MGEVFKAEDLVKKRQEIINKAVRDLSPGVQDLTKKIFKTWNGKESEKRLKRLLGDKETKRILKKMSEY